MKKVCFLASIVISLTWSFAQQQTPTHYLYWLRYQNQLNFTPALMWNNEVDNRRFVSPHVENQLIGHSILNYDKGTWHYGGGLTLSWAFAQQPEVIPQHSVFELRPMAEVSHKIPLRKLTLQNRIRVDNRFLETNEERTVFEESNYICRIRYRLQVEVPLRNSAEGTTLVNLKLADELMVNHKENLFDQNRVTATTEFYINKKFSFEAQYLYIYQQRLGRDTFLERHAMRFTLVHSLMLY